MPNDKKKKSGGKGVPDAPLLRGNLDALLIANSKQLSFIDAVCKEYSQIAADNIEMLRSVREQDNPIASRSVEERLEEREPPVPPRVSNPTREPQSVENDAPPSYHEIYPDY